MRNRISIGLLLFLLGSNVSQAQTQRLINTRDMYPSMSPDGKQMVFQSNRTGSNQLFIMDMDGGKLRQLGDFPLGAETPVFSPDGKTVLYRKVIKAAGFNWELGSIEKNSEIFIAGIDGGDETNISNNAAFDGWPVFSPDGKRIAFASNRSGPARTGQIWLMNTDGSGLQQLSQGPWSHAQPVWAFNGQSIYAYQLTETEDYEFGSIVSIKVMK